MTGGDGEGAPKPAAGPPGRPGGLRHDAGRGIAFMLVSCAVFSLMSVVVKDLGARIPFEQQMFFRNVLAVPLAFALALRAAGGRPAAALRTRRPGGHLLRACTGTLAMGCSFYALTVLPLAEHQALTNTTPLFATLLAIPFLGERVGIHRAGAVLLGFAGILVVALGQGAFTGGVPPEARLGLAAAIGHGVFAAGTTLLVRSLSATEASGTILLWQSLLMSLFTSLALPFVWVTPTGPEWLLLLSIGVLGGLGQWLLTEAWASAQVSAIAPYSYTSLLWAAGFGWLFFGDVPGAATLAGAALIVAASFYILHREVLRKARPR